MTPLERAEKIKQAMLMWDTGLFYVRGSKGFIDFIAAQISEAKKEARINALCDENPEIEKQLDEARREGFRFGVEASAQFTADQCDGTYEHDSEGADCHYCGMAKQIRALQYPSEEK